MHAKLISIKLPECHSLKVYHVKTGLEDLADAGISNTHKSAVRNQKPIECFTDSTKTMNQSMLKQKTHTFSNSMYVSPGITDIIVDSEDIAACCSSKLSLFKPTGPNKTCKIRYHLAVEKSPFRTDPICA